MPRATVTMERVEPLGFTMEEAAVRMRISRRNLQELIKDHPHYYLNGARKLFTADDILALMQAMRQEAETCRLHSNHRAPARAHTGRSGVRTSESTWIEAQRLLRKR